MKEFPLSTPTERILGISFSIVFIAILGGLLYMLREYTAMLILCGLFSLILAALLVFYMISVTKSTCFVDKENMVLEVKGLPSYTKDISSAVLLQTVSRRSGHTINRVLIFSDAEEKIIAVVPTLYTSKRGLMAEPMAKEMAAYLGIEFQANVPAWEYDKEAMKIHEQEEAEREKQERKERIARRRQKLLNRYGKK